MELQFPTGQNLDEWQVWTWNLPDELLTRPQKLQFMLVLGHAFNNFDPFRVVPDLLKHRDLWQGVVMDRGFVWRDEGEQSISRLRSDLIKLRDIGRGFWNVDTLFILTRASHEGRWRELTAEWAADEVSFLEGEDVGFLLGAWGGQEDIRILTVWWD
jgi:hypothetical protein